MTDRITAGELRAMGVPIPESIPDCAGMPRSAVKMSVGEVTSMDGDITIKVNINLSFDAAFEWIDVRVVLGSELP